MFPCRQNTGNLKIWKNTGKTQGINKFGKIQGKHRELKKIWKNKGKHMDTFLCLYSKFTALGWMEAAPLKKFIQHAMFTHNTNFLNKMGNLIFEILYYYNYYYNQCWK